MNAIFTADQIIQDIIKSKKRSITDNELLHFGKIAPLVLEVLKLDYNAHYTPSDDLHYCGTWYFDSPFWRKEQGYKLQYCFLETQLDENTWEDLCLDTQPYSPSLIEEIIRLEDNALSGLWWKYQKDPKKYKELFDNELKRIIEVLKRQKAYIGKERIWRIIETFIYTKVEE